MSLVLRANDAWNQDHSVEGALAARKAYENVLRIDPAFAPALVGLGYTYQMQLANARDASRERENLLREMDDVSNRAIRADRDDPGAWSLRSDTLALQGRWNAAFEANAQALALDPHQVDALHSRAALLIRTGDPEQALRWLDQAIALSPRGRDLYTSLLYQCRARLALGQLGEAIGTCERAIALDGTWWYPHLLLLSAYALSGDMPRAAVERARLLEKQPGMSIARFRAHKVSNDPAYLRQTEAYVIAGLRSAGIPEE